MKLAIITAFPPSKVTLNEYGYHLAKNFVQNEQVKELVLITDHTEEQKLIDFDTGNCKITIRESWNFNSYRNLFSIYKTILKEKPDAVMLNLQFMKFGDKKIPAAMGLLIPLLLSFKKIPTVSLLHNILEQVDLDSAGFTSNKLIQKVYNFIGSMLTRFILKSDIVAVTISKYVNILKKKYKKENIVQIQHGTFETPPIPSLILPDGPKKVMAFGKFGTYKKVEVLIEAVRKIRENTNEDIELVIAGTDSPNTPGYLANVQEKYKHVSKLIFTGYVEESQVPVIFSESAVVVFPYTSTTGSSGVLHQAGSYGRAVVLPDMGDLGILIREEGYTGEFFIPDDVDSLAKAIQKILTNDIYRIQLGMQNYKAACSLPMNEIVIKYINLFNGLINDPSSLTVTKNEEGSLRIPKAI